MTGPPEEEARPRVVAVVLNWCGAEDTAACLESLAESEYPALTTLLVDNGSPDGSGDGLARAFPHLPYLQTGRNLGYSGGNNLGIAWARERDADYVFVVNNDTVVDPAAIRRLVGAAEGDPEAAAVVPTIVYATDPGTIWYAGGSFSPLHGLGLHHREGTPAPIANGQPPEPVTFASGCACLFRMDALDGVGLFAEDFFAYVEDAELSVRLLRAGHRILHVPGARVLHRTTTLDADPEPFQIRLRDRNRRRLMRRHFPLRDRLPFLARFYATRVVRLARYGVRRDWERARAILEGMTAR